jgi:transcriptional regulator with XRE-family HTH domain
MQKVRKARGLTQEQLADKIGTSTPWIGNIETGRVVPNLAMLQKIARALGVKVKELIPY